MEAWLVAFGDWPLTAGTLGRPGRTSYLFPPPRARQGPAHSMF